ncbi:MAG: hypothetical protein OXK76_10945 [Gammaproteobacteria bacterium]|nr:hypothetical protein [Gammaproteobacteria bacterium]
MAAVVPTPGYHASMSPSPRAPSANFGEVRRHGERQLAVVFRRRLGHAPARVWSAIAEPVERAVWVPGIRFEPAVDVRFDIWFGDACDGPAHVSGRIEVFEPPTRLQLGSMQFALAPDDGGCLLEFTDLLWFDGTRSRVDFANAVLAGWHRFLDTLEIFLDEGVAALDLPEPDYAAIDVPGRDSL